MAKPGDVVEFKAGLHGIDAPRNIAILLDRKRVKGVPWVRVVTVLGEKEIKQEHLTRRAFKARHDGDLKDVAEVQRRLLHLVQQNTGGALAEEAEDDLSRLEEALWESTCDAGKDAWTEEEVAQAHYGASPSPQQQRDVRDALDRCRRAGIGRFQTVGGRGDRWRPWSRAERDHMAKSWQDLGDLRKKLVVTEETEEGRTFRRIDLASAGLGEKERVTLAWVKAAMVQFVDWDGVPDGGEPVAGIGGLGAVAAFGMDLHRQLGFLAQDWIASEHTSRSSDYIHFLLESGQWTPQDAVDGLIRRHVNQEEFFEHVPDEEAQRLALEFPEPDIAQDKGRTDLRHIPCWTIDPADAKDFDDAVGLEELPPDQHGNPGRIRLWVHVADVSHYVRPDTRLDRHAKRRATSVYLPGRVLPMLPPRLSDHLCSLRDDGDRFALSVSLEVDAQGKIGKKAFHKSVIRVTENLHYGLALERARAGAAPFTTLLGLAKRMRGHRRGLELETGELKVLLGATGFSALEKHADDATRMIETFMVAANEAVAQHLSEQGVAQLFRCHPLPHRDRAERFSHQLATMGFRSRLALPKLAGQPEAGAAGMTLLDQLKAGGGKLNLFGGGMEIKSKPAAKPAQSRISQGSQNEPTGESEESEESATPSSEPKPVGFVTLTEAEREEWLAPFRAALEELASAPDEGLSEVATLKMLGCMGRAFYTPDNQGHFGLASTHYCHFTSPIRRYPDLVVHRNLKWLIDGRAGAPPHSADSLRALCDHCSNQERAADGLERRIKASCLVLASLQGEETAAGEAAGPKAAPDSRARVTGLTPASLFVLRGDGIEARIPARDLPGGPYQVDEWESMLFLGDLPGERGKHDDPTAFAGASTKQLLEWLDAESGEVRRVRARLGDKVTVRLAGRDVADGRTGARLVSW